VDSAAQLRGCEKSLPFYVDVGRYELPEELDIDMRIRNGVVKDEALRQAQLKEYAFRLGKDMANQTTLKEVRSERAYPTSMNTHCISLFSSIH